MAGCGKLTPARGENVHSSTTSTWTYLAVGPWMLATGLDSLKAVSRVVNISGLTYQPAYQVAETRIDNPSSWTLIGSSMTSGAPTCTGVVDVSTDTAANFYFRLGVAYKATSSFGEGDATLQTAFEQCGQLVATRTLSVDVSTNVTSTAPYDEPLTDWMPAEHVAKVKFAVLMTGVDHVTCQAIVQTATTSVEVPGSWAALGSSIAPVSGDRREMCTGDLAPTGLGTVMWVRFGLRTWMTSGGSRGTATITVAVATRAS